MQRILPGSKYRPVRPVSGCHAEDGVEDGWLVLVGFVEERDATRAAAVAERPCLPASLSFQTLGQGIVGRVHAGKMVSPPRLGGQSRRAELP